MESILELVGCYRMRSLLVESRIKAGTHGVDVIENIPSGNYEIWFEGPYEAREV